MTHGGKRHHHTPPLLSPEQVRVVSILRKYKVPYKIIAKLYPVSRDTLYRAAVGARTYQDYNPQETHHGENFLA